MGTSYQGKEEGQMGSAVWKEECTEGVAGVWNENEQCHIYAAERLCGLRNIQTSGGAPKRVGGGGGGGCEERIQTIVCQSRQGSTQSRQRTTNGD